MCRLNPRSFQHRALLLAAVIQSVGAISAESDLAESDLVLEEVLITGSRLPVAKNDVSMQPVYLLDDEALKNNGGLTVADMLAELPMFGDPYSSGSSINALNGGFSADVRTINLRNLGAERSLVLVNGQRHIGGNVGTSAVDLNSIPTGLIDRVEILTGGASAVYGADAVSGVVNVVLKDSIDGTDLSLRGGNSGEDDGGETELALTHGNRFQRGNYKIGFEYTKQDDILGSNRDFAQYDGSAATGLAGPENGSAVGPQGAFVSEGLGGGGFAEDGTYVPGLDATRFQRMPFRSLIPETERYLVSGGATWQLDDSNQLFIDATYNKTTTTIQYDPQFAIFSDSGFARSGAAGFYFPSATLAAVNGTVTANDLGGELQATNRRFLEYGAREAEIERELARSVLGLRGQLGKNSYELYYQYGQVKATQTDFNTVDKLRFLTAIDPVECAATEGCEFADIYGRGTLSVESLNYVSDDLESDSKGTQHIIGGSLTGEAFTLGRQSAEFVVGFEYRDESATIEPNDGLLAVTDPVTDSGNLVGLRGTRTFFGDTDSSYDVSEIYGELSLPFSERFEAGIALRASDYSTVGSEITAGLRADYIATDVIRFRGSVGTATRAPNIIELAAPEASVTTGIADPCDSQADDGTALSASANCSNFVAGDFNPSDLDQQTRSVTGGNEELDSETALTTTLGVVFSLENTTFSLDFYQIAMEDVLADAFSAQATLTRCVDTLDPFFCNNVSRDATTGVVTNIRSYQTNLAEEDVSGLELSFEHTWALATVNLQWSGIYSHLLEHTRKVNDEAEEEDLTGRVDNIENRFNSTFQIVGNKWHSGIALRWMDDAVQSVSADPAVATGNNIDSVTYLDLFAGFSPTDSVTISGGIENITDEDSPTVTQLYENSGSADVVSAGIYDVRGTFYYLQASYKF